jgi:3-oxoacyl-[acyl-carrier protein] reductase
LPLDDPKSIDRALDELVSLNIDLNAIVLCASAAPVTASFLKTTPQQLVDQLNVAVIQNHYLIAQLWKRFFRSRGNGHIVALLSAASEQPPWAHMTSYVAAKRGLQSIIECALIELGTGGLRASFVSPGHTETPMLMGQHPHVIEAARAKTRNGKFRSPDDVAAVIVQALDNPPSTPSPKFYKVD